MITPDRHVRRSGDDYGKALANLLPVGQAWPRESSSVLMKVVRGLAQIFGYADGRVADLLERETDPRITVEMLSDWERAFGLPDNCLPSHSDDTDLRRTDLVYKMTLLGDQSREFFIDQGGRLGETVAIREYAPYMCGVSRVGDSRQPSLTDDLTSFRWQLGPKEMRFHWKVNIEHVLSGAECVFNRYRPAHTEIVFTYSSVLDRAMATYYFLGI